MRCYCCDKNLSDYESTLRSKSTGEYLDTCLKCLQGLEIEYVGNQSLKRKFEEDPGDLDEDNYEDKSDMSEYIDWVARDQYPSEDS